MKNAMNTILQIAYVVEDLQASMQHWARHMGVGPFFTIEHMPIHGAMYRNQPSNPDLSYGLGFSGSVQIELIQQHDDRPSIYREILAGRSSGYHHVWNRVRDFRKSVADFEAAGCPTVFTGTVTGAGRFAYLDTTKLFGGFVEIMDIEPGLLRAWTAAEEVAANWDGKQLTLPFPAF